MSDLVYWRRRAMRSRRRHLGPTGALFGPCTIEKWQCLAMCYEVDGKVNASDWVQKNVPNAYENETWENAR